MPPEAGTTTLLLVLVRNSTTSRSRYCRLGICTWNLRWCSFSAAQLKLLYTVVVVTWCYMQQTGNYICKLILYSMPLCTWGYSPPDPTFQSLFQSRSCRRTPTAIGATSRRSNAWFGRLSSWLTSTHIEEQDWSPSYWTSGLARGIDISKGSAIGRLVAHSSPVFAVTRQQGTQRPWYLVNVPPLVSGPPRMQGSQIHTDQYLPSSMPAVVWDSSFCLCFWVLWISPIAAWFFFWPVLV